MITALVPIKRNSQRIPNKNFLEINSKPLFFWILDSLLNSEFVDEIVINHDDNYTVQEVSKYFNSIKFCKRPDELFGDKVSMNKIIDDDLNHSDGTVYLQTHSTNPLLKVSTINNALNRMLATKLEKDSIFSVTKIQTRLYDQEGKAINHNPKELIRTQDLPPIFEENSCFFIFTKGSFAKSNKQRIGVNPEMFEIEKIEIS